MAGLLNTQPSEAQAPRRPQGEAASPEMQQQFEKYVSNGMRLLHSEQTRDEIVKMVDNETPELGAAMALAAIVERLDASLAESGIQIDPKAKLAGVQELMGQVIEIAQIVSSKEFTPDSVTDIIGVVAQEGGIR